MSWKLKTLKDVRSDYGLPDNAHVRCEKCHCPNIPLDMMFDVRHLSDDTKLRMNVVEHEFICDACLHTVYFLGQVSHHHFFTESGAPPEVMDRIWEHMQAFPYAAGTHAHKHREQLKNEKNSSKNK